VENSEVKKVPVREEVGTYQNVSVFVSPSRFHRVPANTQLGIEEHHHRGVLIPNATKGEKQVILNEHYYGLERNDLGGLINASVTITKKIVTGNKEYRTVDIRKTPGKSESVYLLNTERPDLVATVPIPYTNFGVCIIPKVLEKNCVSVHPDVSAYVYKQMKRVAADAECDVEEHLLHYVLIANEVKGARDVVVNLEYYGLTEADLDRQLNFNVTVFQNTAWNRRESITVKLRKTEGVSRDCLLINTLRPELLGVQIPYTNATICVLRRRSEEERAEEFKMSQQLAREQARQEARAALLPTKAQSKAA
jgi:hypothetical protein